MDHLSSAPNAVLVSLASYLPITQIWLRSLSLHLPCPIPYHPMMTWIQSLLMTPPRILPHPIVMQTQDQYLPMKTMWIWLIVLQSLSKVITTGIQLTLPSNHLWLLLCPILNPLEITWVQIALPDHSRMMLAWVKQTYPMPNHPLSLNQLPF